MLTQVRTIALPNVEGRIDHLAIDARRERLFVAALGHDAVEVVDLKTGAFVRSLGGLAEPQGVCFVPESDRLYVANGGDGSVRVFAGANYERVGTIAFDHDADNLRYEPRTREILVGHGAGAVAIFSLAKNALVADIAVGAHPEAFQVEPDTGRIFVNVPGARTILVLDRTQRKVAKHWPIEGATANFPMALDAAQHRLFVATRWPSRLLVYNTDSGASIASVDVHGDCDDLFYDTVKRRVYGSCGEGFVDVVTQRDADHYVLSEAVQTAAGARTSLLVGDRLYVAVPRTGHQSAEVRVYAVAL